MRKVYFVLASLAWCYAMPTALALDIDRYSQLAKDGKVTVQRVGQDGYLVVSKRYDHSTGQPLSEMAEPVDMASLEQQIATLTQQVDTLALRRDELVKLKAHLKALPE